MCETVQVRNQLTATQLLSEVFVSSLEELILMKKLTTFRKTRFYELTLSKVMVVFGATFVLFCVFVVRLT